MLCDSNQVSAFQILAGRKAENEAEFLEAGGASGFSTFMAYFLLLADALAGGENMLPIIKEYFGAMLSRGATTFWEDFDMEWLNGSGRIDEIPEDGVKDIHGDTVLIVTRISVILYVTDGLPVFSLLLLNISSDFI